MKPPATPPSNLDAVFAKLKLSNDLAIIGALWDTGSAGLDASYDHWEKVRFRKPRPPLTPIEAWAAMKAARRSARKLLPFFDMARRPFHYILISDFLRALHEIDSNARGLIGMPGKGASAEGRDIYLQKSLVEEPFSSSALEGAATTREVAKKMIEEGRKPRTLDERMVINNYRAMSFIRERRDEALTSATIIELHRILTIDTLERPEKVGVLRTPDDDVRVVESVTGETLHMPPPAADLAKRLEALCEFANAPSNGKDGFLHPVIRAVILHFMLAYDHPFWDGNGRCARALFYWCVLRHGYWLLQYVSISSVIRRAPMKYGMAFLYSETDEGDLTYFIRHQLDVVETALADLQKYLADKGRELAKLGQTMGELERRLNKRQLPIIQEALKRDTARYTIAEQARLRLRMRLTEARLSADPFPAQ